MSRRALPAPFSTMATSSALSLVTCNLKPSPSEITVAVIPLAALIFGKWKPKTALIACLLFGFTDALQIRLQGVALPIVGIIPVQFIQAIPYVLTVVLLAGFVGKAIAPNAIGQPYIKEQ